MMKHLFLLLSFSICTFLGFARQQPAGIIDNIKKSPARIILSSGETTNDIKINRSWNGSVCSINLVNNTGNAVKVKEVVLFSLNHLFAPETPIYAEGFQMLSQTAGTLAKPADIGGYTDRGHYKLEEPAGYRVVYNILNLMPQQRGQYLLGFASANRFIGKFYLSADTVKVVMDLENLEIPAGASWKLEDFFMEENADRNVLLDHLSAAIAKNHPRLKLPLATGWSSWAGFGPDVTAKNVYDNLQAIKKEVPKLKYIQIDDGYQASMGDWLTIGKSFGGGIRNVLTEIKKEGFEPAIWVAPFICDSTSTIYKEHKDWLLKDDEGQPLRSDKVGFGGWRLGPWYVLDGTHPEVQKHLEQLFKKMNQQWGCTYFKLDANYWGAIHKAHYYRKNATRTEAYREGMKAIIKGAGNSSYILGCNHPMWPSIGLVHASRTSNDVDKNWKNFTHTGRENLYRSWQNGRLWWNDPDCLLLTGDLTENMYMFHASLLYATGGMLLSGDDIASIPSQRLPVLQKLSVPSGKTANFNADTFDYGWINEGKHKNLVVLNWTDKSKSFNIPVDKPCTLTNYFTGEKVGSFEKEIVLKDFSAQNGGVYIVEEK